MVTADCELRVTLQLTLLPAYGGYRVSQTVTAKPAKDGVDWVMISLELPTIVNVRDGVWPPQAWTLPKLTAEGFDVSCADSWEDDQSS